MSQYTTQQGDTWDTIAYFAYGEGYETQAGEIMKANPKLLEYFVFPQGIVVNIPELEDETSDLPPWRQ